MPKIQKVFTLNVSPEQFLNNCSGNELQEIALLINTIRYQNKMQECPGVSFEEAREALEKLAEVAIPTSKCRICKSSDTENKKFISKTLCEDCWEATIGK